MANFMDLFDELERIHPSIFWRDAPSTRRADAGPAADIHETEDGYLIEVELPGCRSADVDVDVSDDVLHIKSKLERTEAGTLLRAERAQGEISRDFRLPRGTQPSDVTARVENGLLTVTVPKASTERTTRIEIK